MRRRTCYFSGRVQGVGFRYTVADVAKEFTGVAGFVRNLPDGRVEVVMEGDEAAMEQLVQTVHEKMEGFVRGRTDDFSPATGEFGSFSIRH